ncbi:MAG TPA: DegQ family serine endoprotease [Casimicrobiaceae bacterium]|nr:DegQ family serine endoprotease [Casimicrobiaceae bacterium]
MKLSLPALALAALVAASSLMAPAGPVLAQAVRALPDFTELYEKQGPAVVSIDVTQKIKRSGGPQLSEDDPFYEFFRRFGQVPRGRTPERDIEAQAAGSGFIISADGYLITNAHVVENADEVNVRLTDRREFKAKVIGSDKRTDIALLKIDATNLPKVTIGDVEKAKVGEWVVAIGKPFGLENSMTAGIISAKGRDLPQENLVPFLQTDVAINPGNSGGPLFNLKGEVIGINSLIFSRSGGYMGLSFAIPIDVAMNTVQQLKEKGRVTRGRIGVQIQEVMRDTAEAFNLPKPTGALVNSVEKGGPSDKAGIEPGDIILKVDGREVRTSSELPRIITAIRPGTAITLTLWRKGTQKDVKVTVAELKEDQAAATPQRRNATPKERAKPNRMGLVLADLTDEQKKELGVGHGVLVEDITGSVRGNVQPGDVILAVISRGQSTEVRNAEHMNGILAKMEKGASVTLQLKRGENTFFSTLRINNGE